MSKERVFFTELEEKLRPDTSGSFKKQVENELYETLAALRRHMDTGLPPEDFQRMTCFKDGLETSLATLDRIWTDFHS